MEVTNVKSSENKLKLLEESIIGLGKDDYPFKHKDYELATCIPCADFSNWIIDRLRENDIWAIKLLEWEIGKDAGLLVGSSDTDSEGKMKPKELNPFFWSTCVNIDEQLSKDVSKYIKCTPNVLKEIFCLLIRQNISNGVAFGFFYNPHELSTNGAFYTFLDILCCNKIDFNFDILRNNLVKANCIYKEYVREYKNEVNPSAYFDEDDLEVDYRLISNNNLAVTLSQFPIGSRLHFWDLINSSYFISDLRMNRRTNLECWFRTNTFGFDRINSNSYLINAGSLKVLDNKEIILSFLTKKELSEILSNFNVTLKPSTGKSIMINKLLHTRQASDYILNFAKSKGLYCFNPLIEDDLRRLIEYKKQLSKILLLLCTIDFGFVFRRSHFFNDNGKYYLVYEDGLKERIPLIYG